MNFETLSQTSSLAEKKRNTEKEKELPQSYKDITQEALGIIDGKIKKLTSVPGNFEFEIQALEKAKVRLGSDEYIWDTAKKNNWEKLINSQDAESIYMRLATGLAISAIESSR